MTSLPITSVLAGLFALMMVVLSLPVSVRRVKVRTTFGDGDDVVLRRRMRAHGNFVEYAPLALAVVALLELGAAPTALVWTIALAFAATRVLHALGMLYVDSPAPRAAAMITQHLTFLSAGAWLIVHATSTA